MADNEPKTVRELIAELQQYPPDFFVVQASDEEGNDFHQTYDVGYGYWHPEYREFTSWTEDGDDDSLAERALTIEESNCVCIWP